MTPPPSYTFKFNLQLLLSLYILIIYQYTSICGLRRKPNLLIIIQRKIQGSQKHCYLYRSLYYIYHNPISQLVTCGCAVQENPVVRRFRYKFAVGTRLNDISSPRDTIQITTRRYFLANKLNRLLKF